MLRPIDYTSGFPKPFLFDYSMHQGRNESPLFCNDATLWVHETVRVSSLMFSFRMRQGRAESPTEAFSPGHRPGLDHSSMAVRPERAKAWPKRRGFFKYNGVGRAFALTGRKGMNSPKPRALPWAESNNWAFSPPIPCVLTRMLVESKMRTSNWTPYQTGHPNK